MNDQPTAYLRYVVETESFDEMVEVAPHEYVSRAWLNRLLTEAEES